MTRDRPAISLGMPVYNGERYLAAALESLLGQSFEDLELVICDNASTDRTAEICRSHAERDTRVRYHRNESNIGASPNYTRTFELARGEFFKWAAHDDLLAPGYLTRCMEALHGDPSLVLVQATVDPIDPEGRPLLAGGSGSRAERVARGFADPARRFDSPDPATRFRDVILHTHWCFEIFGVFRADVLRRATPMTFYGSDLTLLAEVSLWGRILELPEPLFRRRFHPGTTAHLPDRAAREAWAGVTAEDWRGRLPMAASYLHAFSGAIRRAPLSPRQRIACGAGVAGWCLAAPRRAWRNRNSDAHG